MMLRSSSTPVLGSLLASFPDSPGNNSSQHHVSEFHGGCAHRHASSPKISWGNGVAVGYPNLGKSLFHSSPTVGIRRVQSEGNLLGELADGVDEFRRPARKANWRSLEAIPSFSNRSQIDFDSEDEERVSEEEDVADEDLSNSFNVENLVLKQEGGRMYLATGLGVSSGMSLVDVGGISDNSGGRGGSSRPVSYGGGGGDGGSRVTMEQHYRKMLEGDPGNPMVLRNYAQFLHQEKGDLKRAEEYYSRAILADPKDGEILSQYAKLIWELHHDEKLASSYFERAIQASAEDSHIQAAYASFLWDAEEEEKEDEEGNAVENALPPRIFKNGSVASATA